MSSKQRLGCVKRARSRAPQRREASRARARRYCGASCPGRTEEKKGTRTSSSLPHLASLRSPHIMLNAACVAGNVCRPSRTSGCDMRDSKGPCCVDKKSADAEGGRVCTPSTGVSAGDSSGGTPSYSSQGGGGGSSAAISSAAIYCGGRERHAASSYTSRNTLTGNRHP